MSDEMALTEFARLTKGLREVKDAYIKKEGHTWKSYYALKDDASAQIEVGEIIETEFGKVRCRVRGEVQFKQTRIKSPADVANVLGKEVELLREEKE